LNSSFRLAVVWNIRESIFIFSTPGPNRARRVAVTRVFLPAPEGPYTRRWGKSPLFAWFVVSEVFEGLVDLHLPATRDDRRDLGDR